MILVLGVGTLSLEIAMAPRARLIACGPKIDATAMLCVTGNAIGRSFGRRVVRRSVMAGEARVICYLRGKRACRSQMASRAIFFQHRVRFAHAASGIDAMIAGKAAPR